MGFTRAVEDRPTPKEVYNYRIYLLTFSCCLGSWMFGYNNGVIAGVLVLPAFVGDFHLPDSGTSSYNNIIENIVSLLQIGGLVGAMSTFPCMKHYGRRIALACAAVVFLLGALLQTVSYGNLSMMYAGRFITGLGAGSVTVTVPLYIAELSPPSIRGSLVGIYEINNQLSSLMGYWCNYIVNEYIPGTASRQWQIPLAMQIIPSALLIIASLLILPESPRFLVKKGKESQARKVLSFVRHLEPEHEYINLEMEEILEAIQRQDTPIPVPGQEKSRLGLFRELWWKGNRNRVLIGLGLMFGQNLTGINGMNFYTPEIFRSIGFSGTNIDLIATGMYALVKTVATILALVVFIDRAGRRKLLIASSIGTSLALWYIGGFVTAKHIDLTQAQEKSVPGWVAIVCVYIYAASFSIAWNGVVWVYCAEIFPSRIKELAMCLIVASQWLSQFAVARASPSMLSALHGGFFFFFATCITIMGTGVFFLLPETKGRTLERMDEIFGTARERGITSKQAGDVKASTEKGNVEGPVRTDGMEIAEVRPSGEV
ncbi:general substrate transporter [Mollisia scopiformis]|uniref:Quinate transporter n=1 Tax=Mollisia scopiformis TaxID=149040 RepID=A0A194X4U3_MOLSC|nr:general substrate transporter [Mollisia scopiformis]KUJ15196.1 general substrate transporter [Mollisia scopiformis]